MQTNYLLPHKYKILGWILLITGVLSGTILQIFDFGGRDLFDFNLISDFNFDFFYYFLTTDTIYRKIITVSIIIGGLLVGFTKEKIEDEFIYKLRSDSLLWAIILNYIVLLITVVFFYEGSFFTVMIYNMFTPLLFFIIRFNFLKLKSRSDEE